MYDSKGLIKIIKLIDEYMTNPLILAAALKVLRQLLPIRDNQIDSKLL